MASGKAEDTSWGQQNSQLCWEGNGELASRAADHGAQQNGVVRWLWEENGRSEILVLGFGGEESFPQNKNKNVQDMVASVQRTGKA